jgi:transmembrane sensor
MTSNEVWDVAMEWVVIMKSSAKADLSRVECDAWLNRDPSHRIAYEDACLYRERLNKAVALLQQSRPSSPEALLSEIAAVARRARRHRDVRGKVQWCATRVAGVAAVGLLLLMVRYMLSAPEVPVAWVRYDGSQTHHILSDGSELYLNGRSASARARMGTRAREIALDRGEMLISVRRGDARPLLVEVDHWVVRATGTEFSVRRDWTGGEVGITVQEGSVEIDPPGPFWLNRLLRRGNTAQSGQVAVISGGTVHIAQRDPTQIGRDLAWSRGWLYLHGTLEDAVAQFSEYNERRIIIVDPSISKMDVTGVYEAHALEEFVESLRARHVRYELGSATDSGKGTIRLYAERKPN